MARSNHTDQRFRDETNLIRLVEHLQRAHDDASAVGSAEALEEDYMRFNSVAMDMVQAQESARRLSDGFRETAPRLPWNELRALRNVIVHEYDGIDAFALYESATSDAETLLAKLHPYVDSIED
ncbi:HepT-like ribonuclease domain-containing protein [Bifidobacterium ruminantium]|uniref:HepT-like ribonuclease domain-containing protein n=1 Tax=Bifidobacterium ruminantium TaxID=78346 RepID=UPI0024911480|nr:HepT-like ribonuclease domain-containing protein [Bifidobacterium ruminantium]